MTTPRPTIVFVCHGNICRSPMAERIARRAAAEAGIDAVITSAGVSDEEDGNPMDRRARAVLERRGYDVSPHIARQIGADDIRGADLVVAAEPSHVRALSRMAPGASNLALLRDFDPSVPPGTALVDPWYGDAAGFEVTADQIEDAMPGIIAALGAR
ncbi:low molecular weight protein-tyrosine-phosphatase [Acidipropionibacterium timonense]|uniref:low molecular weight protein-tyrosine-phosphatase n=1 Tax=Acidipropionibacterium timonense TaxID=2161818 RepID=UPI001031037D|nr:low molecular weight protein-tyrosine-phosphatase [Acidipropionibacterium timonense]